MVARCILDDNLWSKFSSALKYSGCRITKSTRNTLEGILWYLRTGSPWRDTPKEFGCWQTIYSRFNAWSSSGKLTKVFKELKGDPDFEWISIDSTSVKVHQHASGGKEKSTAIGSSRGGKNTKIHATVDALGNPIEFKLSSGNEHDIKSAPELIKNSYKAESVLADKAYDSDQFRILIESQYSTAIIPLKKIEYEKSNLIKTNTKLDTKLKICSKN